MVENPPLQAPIKEENVAVCGSKRAETAQDNDFHGWENDGHNTIENKDYWDKSTVAIQIKKLFVNRDDIYATQFLQKNKKGEPQKGFTCVRKELNIDTIIDHLSKKKFLGNYNLDKDDMVKSGCWDFDKNTILDFEVMKKLYTYLKEKGFNPLIEKSGGGKYKVHLWIFSKEKIPAKQMRDFMKDCSEKSKCKAHEMFPKQDSINFKDNPEATGNLLKLPCGKHLVTEEMSVFLNDKLEEVTETRDISNLLHAHLENLDTIPVLQPAAVGSVSEQVPGPVDAAPVASDNPNEWDDFFNYCLNNELPAGVEKDIEIGGKEAGINNNILKNMGLWFYQKGYTLEKLDLEVRETFNQNGWAFGDLKGWFSKAVNGSIKDIATGEIVLWCKEFYPSLLNYVPGEKSYLTPEDIKDQTSHLDNFELINEIISLEGKEYIQIKKDSYNLLISLACPKHLEIIKVGNIETDLRIHPAYILPSGKGKMEIKEGVKETYLRFKPDANIKEPRSIHKEQLIGKILRRKKKNAGGKPEEEVIKKYGFAFADLLILEEAHEIFSSNEKNDKDCRDTLTVALDLKNKNFISKQNIDDLDNPDETISGFPSVRGMAFLQPKQLPEEFTTKGLHRRLSINYREFPEKSETDSFVNRLTSKTRDSIAAANFAMFMQKINNLSSSWEFSKDAYDSFILCHKVLLEQGFSMGGKAYHFTKILEYPMQNLLLKISAIRALSNIRTTITKEDVENAFLDIIERFTYELIFVEKKIRGTLDYGASWGGATGKDQECLEWLHKKGALSKETSGIRINSFQIEISKIYDLSIRRARDKYNKLKENGLIKDFLGQAGENKVWITFKPKIINPVKNKELSPYSLYNRLSGRTVVSELKTGKKEDFTHKTDKKTLGRTGRSARTAKTAKTTESVSEKLIIYNQNKNNLLSVRPVRPVQAVRPEKTEAKQ